MVLTMPPVRGGPLVIVAARAGEKAPPDYGDSFQWVGRAVIVRRRRARPASPGTARTWGRPGRRRSRQHRRLGLREAEAGPCPGAQPAATPPPCLVSQLTTRPLDPGDALS